MAPSTTASAVNGALIFVDLFAILPSGQADHEHVAEKQIDDGSDGEEGSEGQLDVADGDLLSVLVDCRRGAAAGEQDHGQDDERPEERAAEKREEDGAPAE